MSLQVELEPDDRKFVKEVKSWWIEAKRQMVWMLIALVVGFGLGKLYTWDAVITDCKVLGMTRFGMTPMGCRVGERAQ